MKYALCKSNIIHKVWSVDDNEITTYSENEPFFDVETTQTKIFDISEVYISGDWNELSFLVSMGGIHNGTC